MTHTRDLSPAPPRRTSGSETVDSPDSVARNYLLKRHTSEGVGRRRIRRPTLDPALASLSDAEMDNRNARVWSVVQASCQGALGLSIVASPNLANDRSIRGLLYCTAQKAALYICRHRYGIPPVRLAEVSSHERGWISHRTRTDRTPNADVDRLIQQWEASGGPSRVDSVEDLVTIQISASAATALAALVGDRNPVGYLSELIRCCADGAEE